MWRWLVRLYVKWFVRVNAQAKCPACGVVAQHIIRWYVQQQCIVHVCQRCTAAWMEDPIVAAKNWAGPLETIEDEEGGVVGSDGVRSTITQHAQRDPVLVQEYKPVRGNPVVRLPRKTG